MTNINIKNIIANPKRSIFFLLVFCFIFIIILNTIPCYKIYKASQSLRIEINTVETQFNNKDFKNLIVTVKKINADSILLNKNLKKVKVISSLPLLSDNIKSAEDLSNIAILASDSFIKIYPILEDNSSILSNNNTGIISMPKEEKAKMISIIYKIQPDLKEVNKNIDNILKLIEKNKEHKNIIKPIKNIWDKIDSYYSNIKDLQTIFPLIKALPELLGAPKEAKYLLLFQNNTELRPTGGFIGSYGVVKVSYGDINNIFTDNVYNLDNANIGKLKIPAPQPIQDHLNLPYLYMRDANWNPDYEESAKYIANLYKKESKNNYPITGVIAITPSVFQDVIGYFGEIKVMGSTFNKDNATDLLNYETKFAYWETRGISESKRKIIIQKLADVLFEKIKHLSFSELKDFTKIIASNLDKKQILLYFNNPEAEKFAIANNWDGKMIDNKNSDYFAVVDANLASGKSDPYIDRNIDYDLRHTDNDLVATLTLTYTHKYDDYVKNTIYQDDLGYVQEYKSYTRIYVPKGAVLKSLQINDDDPDNSKITSGSENGKTFFGIYLAIPKNETFTYKFEYVIPKELANKFENNYSLIYQKQAGISFNNININVNLNKAIKSYYISDENGLTFNSYNKKINLNGLTNSDRTMYISFYSNSDIGLLQKTIKKNYLSFSKEAPLGN